VAALALAGESAAALDSAEIEQRLAELTRRWAGARCVLKVGIELKKKPTDDGGYHSPLMTVPQLARRFSNGASRLWVSDRRALAGLMEGDVVPAGTELVADGWRLLYPKDNDGAYLSLRFAAAPVEARFYFISGLKTIGVGPGIDKVEEFLRFDILEVSSAGERLTLPSSAAPPSAAPPSAAPPSSSAAAAPASPPAGEPALRLLGAGVQPTRVRAGGELEVTVSYELTGGSCQVGERREILRGTEVVQRFDDGFARASGVHSSSKPVGVPAAATPGTYGVRVEVTCGARRVEGSALFEIQ
jgi:hypothetical protein